MRIGFASSWPVAVSIEGSDASPGSRSIAPASAKCASRTACGDPRRRRHHLVARRRQHHEIAGIGRGVGASPELVGEGRVDHAAADDEARRLAREPPRREDEAGLRGAHRPRDADRRVGGAKIALCDDRHRGAERTEDHEEHHRKHARHAAARGGRSSSGAARGSAQGSAAVRLHRRLLTARAS